MRCLRFLSYLARDEGTLFYTTRSFVYFVLKYLAYLNKINKYIDLFDKLCYNDMKKEL